MSGVDRARCRDPHSRRTGPPAPLWGPCGETLSAAGSCAYGCVVAGSVAAEIDRTHVRLAELVAALSLGIDLGFGQPREHVLGRCLIALRRGGAVGLDGEQRADVYYTALLVNVGCHSDAHE